MIEAVRTAEALTALKASPKTAKGNVKFVLATDGETAEAEALATGEPLACPSSERADHFGFFLPLAGVSTVAEIKDNPIDIKATGRLNSSTSSSLRTTPAGTAKPSAVPSTSSWRGGRDMTWS